MHVRALTAQRPGATVLALFLLATASAAARANLTFVGVNAGAPIWDGAVLFTDALAADIAGSGCRTVRINFRIDGNPSWTPAHLARYDAVIAAARGHGLAVLGLLSHEIMPVGQDQWNDDADGDGLNPYVSAYAATAWLLIDRYKDDIKLFEVWNEPDCWSIPPDQNDPRFVGCTYILPRVYANLLAETYRECATHGGATFFADHGVSLASGGLFAHDIGGSFSTAGEYMRQVYQRTAVWNAFLADFGRRYPWSYFGYHFYLNQGEPVEVAELAAFFADVRFRKGQNHDPAPFLVTEFGWTSNNVGLQGQADNLRDTYDWLRSQSDVAAAYWYQWNSGDPNGDWGLVYSIGNPKPSYFEFAAQAGGVTNPPGAADFDGDDDVDLVDFAFFQRCFAGGGGECETGGGIDAPVASWQSAASLAALPAPIAAGDLLHGVIGVIEAGGFHPATPTTGGGGLSDLTDGVAGAPVEAVLVDFPGGEPPNSADPLNRALQVRYDFAVPRTLSAIRVFAANTDGRAWQNYDVQVSRVGDAAFTTLLNDVRTGAFGQVNSGGIGATATTIAGAAGGPIAADVDAIRFVFYPVSNTTGRFDDEYDSGEPGDADGRREAFESSIIKEIDVFDRTGPAPTANRADLDGDGDVDGQDYARLLLEFAGPE